MGPLPILRIFEPPRQEYFFLRLWRQPAYRGRLFYYNDYIGSYSIKTGCLLFYSENDRWKAVCWALDGKALDDVHLDESDQDE